MSRTRVFSGIQPSGELHLGNYFGAVQNWVRMQDDYDAIYCVVDYHAVTSRTGRESDKFQDPEVGSLAEMSVNMAGDLIATGIDPERSILFVQSHVPEHTELAWIFSCIASYGDLTRMTQFKDKADRSDYVSVGLFSYPVLQAADILLYRASKVPVGEDQVQHLELARRIGRRFNTLVGDDYFPEVDAELTEAKRVMSLAEPTQKMSKSLGAKHYIGLMEDPKSVHKLPSMPPRRSTASFPSSRRTSKNRSASNSARFSARWSRCASCHARAARGALQRSRCSAPRRLSRTASKTRKKRRASPPRSRPEPPSTECRPSTSPCTRCSRPS